MSRLRTHLALVATLAALMALHWLLGPNPEQRSWQWLPEMVDSVPYESFAASPVFADGKVLQPPPVGTVPRGLPPLHYEVTEEDARRAGRELANPFALEALQPPELDRGAAVYATFCDICHGSGGAGDGTVARRGFPAPPSLLAEKARNLADGEMFHILTYGRANMPAYRSQIDREDRWRAVLHVRRLQEETPAEPSGTGPDGTEPAPSGDPSPNPATTPEGG